MIIALKSNVQMSGGSIAAAAIVRSKWIPQSCLQQLKQAHMIHNAGHEKRIVTQWWWVFDVQQLAVKLEVSVRANNELLPDTSLPRGFRIKIMYVPVHKSVLL